MQEPKDLINWAGISRHLCNDRSAITKTRIPKKHEERIDELLDFISKWQKDTTE